MATANESEVTSKPSEIILSVRLSNFRDEVRDITDLVFGFSIYEDLFSPTVSCELVVADAEGLNTTFPIVGDEHVTIIYKTRGTKVDREQYTTRVRSFQIYKMSKVVEAKERQQSYILHGVDDHFIMNEMIDLNNSYVGSNCVKAISDIFKSNFIKNVNDEFRPYTIYPKLYGIDTEDVLESTNSSFYISPGVTPFEAINYLKGEAEHKNLTNSSDYVFYQDYNGFHLTTLTELKSKPAQYSYTVQDMGADKDDNITTRSGGVVARDNQEDELDDAKTVLRFKLKKTFDSLHHLGLGTYGNRVAAIDILTKRFDEKSFSYYNEYQSLNTMDPGSLISDNSLYRFSGSTHTRFIPTELLSSSIPTGEPTGFTNEIANYNQTPYFYPIDKEKPDPKKDKLEGTISNKSANERQRDLLSKDTKLSNPRRKQYLLNKRISNRGILDTILIDIVIPGNSDIKVGDTINFYVPQTSAELDRELYNFFFGQKNPKFLVVKLNQKYTNEVGQYHTILTITKDSYKDEISTIMKKVADSRGEPTIRDDELAPRDLRDPGSGGGIRDPGSGGGIRRSNRTIRSV